MIYIFMFIFLFIQVDSSGKIAVYLISYENSQKCDYTGACCNGDRVFLENMETLCSKDCNTQIDLCLDTYKSDVNFDSCPYGQRRLSAMNEQSSITFTVPTAGDVENPVLFPFDGNFQTNGYRLKIAINNELTMGLKPIDFITIDFNISFPTQLITNQSLTELNYSIYEVIGTRASSPPTKIKVGVAAYCDNNWYDSGCNTSCIPQDSCDGHYSCDPSNGSKVCLSGFSGVHCTIANFTQIGCKFDKVSQRMNILDFEKFENENMARVNLNNSIDFELNRELSELATKEAERIAKLNKIEKPNIESLNKNILAEVIEFKDWIAFHLCVDNFSETKLHETYSINESCFPDTKLSTRFIGYGLGKALSENNFLFVVRYYMFPND